MQLVAVSPFSMKEWTKLFQTTVLDPARTHPSSSNHCSPEAVDEELLRDVVLAVGVLEGEVELVVAVEHAEAVLGLRPRTPLRAARPVYVDLR